MVAKLARETGVDAQARSYTLWSHVVTLLYAQLLPSVDSKCTTTVRPHGSGLR